jgi:hypothetical protein
MDINNITVKARLYAPSILRYGMSLVILWFAMQQLTNSVDWIAYVPASLVGILHISAITLVKFNGTFELVFGLLLLIGWQIRWVGLLLALHLFDIMYVVGYGEIGVRDFGLAVATLSIAMYGSDILAIHQHRHPTITK